MKILLRLILMGVLVFGFIGCGGGGSDASPIVEDKETSIIKMSMNDDIIIPTKELVVESTSFSDGNDSIIIQGKIKDKDVMVDKIVFIPPSDSSPSGLFMKVINIEEEIDATSGDIRSKISYRVPELNEVISDLKIEEKNIVEEGINISQVVIPSPIVIDENNNTISVPLERRAKEVSSDGAIIFGNSDGGIKIGLGEKEDGTKSTNSFHFKFEKFKLYEKKNKNESLSALLALNGGIELTLPLLVTLSKVSINLSLMQNLIQKSLQI